MSPQNVWQYRNTNCGTPQEIQTHANSHCVLSQLYLEKSSGVQFSLVRNNYEILSRCSDFGTYFDMNTGEISPKITMECPIKRRQKYCVPMSSHFTIFTISTTVEEVMLVSWSLMYKRASRESIEERSDSINERGRHLPAFRDPMTSKVVLCSFLLLTTLPNLLL